MHTNNLQGDGRHTKRASSEPSISADKLPGIRHVIAVGSGKGGVGKSTVSVNLALALHQIGYRVGIVDADILGPSIPGMLGLPAGRPPTNAEGKIIPADCHGLKVISMGMVTGDDKPAILRGPMVSQYLGMFIDNVEWGLLDYLILDLPPGTGDVQLTLAQNHPLSGAIIVTTPQDVSLKIARRGLRMFETVHVPMLGIIENMSTFTCPHCGKGTDIFRSGGGERMSRELNVPFMGSIPLDADVVMSSDKGLPIVLGKPDSTSSVAYQAIAADLAGRLAGSPSTALKPFVWTWESDEGAPRWIESAIRPSGSRTKPIGFLQRDPRTLSVLWEDGHRSNFDVRDLRLACRCAVCIEEVSGRPLLDPKSVPPDVAPITIKSIGNYAINIGWDDGHSSGIYSFESLRALGDRADTAVENV